MITYTAQCYPLEVGHLKCIAACIFFIFTPNTCWTGARDVLKRKRASCSPRRPLASRFESPDSFSLKAWFSFGRVAFRVIQNNPDNLVETFRGKTVNIPTTQPTWIADIGSILFQRPKRPKRYRWKRNNNNVCFILTLNYVPVETKQTLNYLAKLSVFYKYGGLCVSLGRVSLVPAGLKSSLFPVKWLWPNKSLSVGWKILERIIYVFTWQKGKLQTNLGKIFQRPFRTSRSNFDLTVLWIVVKECGRSVTLLAIDNDKPWSIELRTQRNVLTHERKV